MNKALKIYLSVYTFITMVTSLICIVQLFDKIGVPSGFISIYVLIHIGSFALMLSYAKEL